MSTRPGARMDIDPLLIALVVMGVLFVFFEKVFVEPPPWMRERQHSYGPASGGEDLVTPRMSVDGNELGSPAPHCADEPLTGE